MSRHERGYFNQEVSASQKEVLELWWKAAEFFNISAPEVVSGYNNIPDKPPYIVVANHRGWAEILALWETWPHWIYWMTRDSNFKIPILNHYFRKAGMFPVTRGTVDRAALAQASQIISEGKVLGMMIEGTRGRGSQVTQHKPPRRGTARIANDTKVAVVPVAVVGSEHYIPLIDEMLVRSPFKIPGEIYNIKMTAENPRIRIAVGEPVEEHILGPIDSSKLTEILDLRLKNLVDLLES